MHFIHIYMYACVCWAFRLIWAYGAQASNNDRRNIVRAFRGMAFKLSPVLTSWISWGYTLTPGTRMRRESGSIATLLILSQPFCFFFAREGGGGGGGYFCDLMRRRNIVSPPFFVANWGGTSDLPLPSVGGWPVLRVLSLFLVVVMLLSGIISGAGGRLKSHTLKQTCRYLLYKGFSFVFFFSPVHIEWGERYRREEIAYYTR